MRRYLYLIGILVIGLLLRFYALTHQSLWADEIFIANNLKGNLWDTMTFLWYEEPHPPLYILILRGWAAIFGASDWSLRAFSALLGTINVYLIYLLAKLLWNETIGLITAALFAISPFAIYYAQEMRSYSLWLTFSLLSFIFFFQSLYFKRDRFIHWSIVSLLNLYTHFFSVFVFFIQGLVFLYALIRHRESSFRNFFFKSRNFWIAQIILLIGALPMIWWTMLRVADEPKGFEKEFSIVHLIYTTFTWVFGYSFGPSVNELHDATVWTVIVNYGVPIGFSLLIICFFFLFGIWREKSNHERRGLWVILGITFLLVVATPLYSQIYYNVRATMFIVPFFYALLGIGIYEAWRLRGSIILTSALVLMMLYSLHQYYHNPKYFRDDVRGTALVLSQSSPLIPVLTGRMLAERDVSHYYDTSKQTFLNFEDVYVDDIDRYSKLWVIWNRMWIYRNMNEIKKFLGENYQIKEEHHFPGVTAELLEKKSQNGNQKHE